ncbi:hypothetical protein, partial [Chloroflexus sp.]|uniref:hypothetical protein n=1 Tax=Chloroflexus sp. TaxID=1904827 RepID=UPI00404B9672
SQPARCVAPVGAGSQPAPCIACHALNFFRFDVNPATTYRLTEAWADNSEDFTSVCAKILV